MLLYKSPPVRACERGKNPLDVRNGPAILYDIGISCKGGFGYSASEAQSVL